MGTWRLVGLQVRCAYRARGGVCDAVLLTASEPAGRVNVLQAKPKVLYTDDSGARAVFRCRGCGNEHTLSGEQMRALSDALAGSVDAALAPRKP